MISNHRDTIIFGRYIPIIEDRVGLEIMHFCIVQFMFEDKSILHYMNNEQFDSDEKKTVPEGLGIIEAYDKCIQFTYS